MSERQNLSAHQIEREKVLYRYSHALEKSDFDVIASILRMAEDDPILEQMLLELDEVYAAEDELVTHTDAAEVVRRLLVEHFSVEFVAEDALMDIPPLTVNTVIAHLEADTAISGAIRQEMTMVAQQVRQSNVVLPADLSQRGVIHLFEQIGIAVSKQFQKLFRNKAIFLSMGRAHGMAHLAATRRQRQQRQQSPRREEGNDE